MSDEQFSAVQLFELCVQCSNTVVYCEFREKYCVIQKLKAKLKTRLISQINNTKTKIIFAQMNNK